VRLGAGYRARLALHGIACEAVRARSEGVRVEAFRATHVRFAAAPFEGRMRVTLSGSWGRETQDITAGALFVPIAQASARLVMHLLEPQAPDSFAAWGFFNACFEQKEYLEPYVAEQIARTVLAQHRSCRMNFRASSRRIRPSPRVLPRGWNSSCAITHHGTLMRISIRYSVWMSCWLRRARRGLTRSCKFKSC